MQFGSTTTLPLYAPYRSARYGVETVTISDAARR